MLMCQRDVEVENDSVGDERMSWAGRRRRIQGENLGIFDIPVAVGPDT